MSCHYIEVVVDPGLEIGACPRVRRFGPRPSRRQCRDTAEPITATRLSGRVGKSLQYELESLGSCRGTVRKDAPQSGYRATEREGGNELVGPTERVPAVQAPQ